MRLFRIIGLLLLLSSPAFAQDFDKGYEAAIAGDFEAALGDLRPLAEEGHPRAQFLMGYFYRTGSGVAQNIDESVRWFFLSAEQGHKGSQYQLGSFYYAGVGVPQNDEEAYKWFRLAADQGDYDLQVYLGVLYQYGRSVPQDFAEAARWYHLASDQGSDRAQHQLGDMYYFGLGFEQDFETAFDWYTRAASKENMYSQAQIGEMHETGSWVPVDMAKAAHWYLLAAEQGHEFAQAKIGVFYQEGTGVPQDMNEALRWYKMAAEQGNTSVQYLIGDIYREGLGVPVDVVEAVRWYRLAAEQGLEDAQSILGYIYYDGKGLPRDQVEAAKWYRLAANQGSETAQSKLGFMYFYGRGIKKNYAESAHWYSLAAEQGNVSAQAQLGEIYFEAKGVPQDIEEAMRWYRLAAVNGNVESQNFLGFEYYYGKNIPKDLVEAASWYRLAAEQGDAEAQSNLSFMYSYGRGVPQDFAAADHWLRLAADQGQFESPKQIIQDAEDQIELLELQYGVDALEKMHPLMTLGDVYDVDLNFVEEALAAYQEGFALAQAILGDDHERTLEFKSKVATASYNLGHIKAAAELRRDLVSRSKRVLGPTDKLTLIRMGTLSFNLTSLGLDVEANRLMKEGLQIATSVYGEDDFSVTGKLGTLAFGSNFDEPSEHQVDTLKFVTETYKENYGTRSENVLKVQAELANAMTDIGMHLSSVEVWAEIVEVQQDNLRLSSSFDEEIRGIVIKDAKKAGLNFAEAAWNTHAFQKMSTGSQPYRGQELTVQDLHSALITEAFVTVQMGQNKTAHAVARSKAKLSLKQAGLHDLFVAYETKQKALRDLGREIANQLTFRAKGNLKNDGKIVVLQEERDRAVVELQVLGDNLKEKFPRFFDAILPQPVSVDELLGREDFAPLLGENEALILLSPPQDGVRGKVWAISLDGMAWAEIPLSQAELHGSLRTLHAMLDGGGATQTAALAPNSRGAFSLDESEDAPSQAGFDRFLAFDLFQDLLGDLAIQSVVKGKSEWILAPQGMLLSLPFATLVTEFPQGGEAGNLDPTALRATSWLGIEKALSIVPAVSSLRVLRRSSKEGAGRADQPFFGLGDPAFDGATGDDLQLSSVVADTYFRSSVGDPDKVRGLARLPGTRLEIESLAAIFDAKEGAILLGSDASERHLAKAQHSGPLSRSKVIVLATHGLMAGAFDGLSEPALAMSPPKCGPMLIYPDAPLKMSTNLNCHDEGVGLALEAAAREGAWVDDGLLTASEVAQLDLDADWVILSACDTAAGENQNPDAEGLSGLARAFFFAGARSLLVSHWPVRDDVAAKLTPDAVARSATGTMTRSEAFRQAMAALLEDESADAAGYSFAHPSAWAPFQVTGTGPISQ